MVAAEKIILKCCNVQSGNSTLLNIICDVKNTYLDIIESPNQKTIRFIELVGLSVSEYNYGRHYSSYLLFREAMSYLDTRMLIKNLTSECFFRLRTKKTVNPDEMFHIPMEERYKVGTRRYSFPGLPCLYFGSSVDVCKLESLNNSSCDYSIAQYKLKEGVFCKVFDLTYFFSMNYDEMDEETMQSFIDLLPLIILCSIRCDYPNDANVRFKKEYIIPQMLLEYIMDNQPHEMNNVIGIKYRSVYHMHDIWEKEEQRQMWNNYVFPAITNLPTGFSPKLFELFPFVGFVH